MIDHIDPTGARNLCAAVVRMAVQDYQRALKTLAKHPDAMALATKKECERFFRDGLELYSDMDGDYYIVQSYVRIYRDALEKGDTRTADYCERFFRTLESGDYIIRKTKEEAEEKRKNGDTGRTAERLEET